MITPGLFNKVMALLVTISLFNSGFSQGPTIVTVNNKKVDDNTLQAIKLLQPDFGLGGDSLAVVNNILKFYTYRKYLTEIAHDSSTVPLAGLSEKIEIAKKVLEEKMTAEFYADYVMANIAVTDAEAKTYYENEKGRYATPGMCDVVYLETADTGKQNIIDLKQKGMAIANLPLQERQSLKNYTDDYLIKSYQLFSNTQNYPYIPALFAAKIQSWIGPFRDKDTNRYVYFFIINRTEVDYPSFQSIKESCIQNIRASKFTLQVQQWNEEALKKYPIDVKLANENKKDAVKILYR